MSAPAPDLLRGLLRDVSRSFYLTLRLLPSAVRPQIGVAYLLARATDTLADTDALPLEQRIEALTALRERILGSRPGPLDFTPFLQSPSTPAEGELLGRIEEVVAVLQDFACFDRCCVREVIATITSGQELDLRRFHGAAAGRLASLATDDDLDDYIFRVAGCVGGFWTRICRSHLFPREPIDLPRYLEDAISFGKGLQLVNILRDLPRDLRHGRCYLPCRELTRHGLCPDDLLDVTTAGRFQPLLRSYIGRTADYLAAGWRYTCVTPRCQVRVRIACALPLLIGAETLQLLATGNVLDGNHRIKVSRRRVRTLLMRTTLLHPFRQKWEGMFRVPTFGISGGS